MANRLQARLNSPTNQVQLLVISTKIVEKSSKPTRPPIDFYEVSTIQRIRGLLIP
jgi:hypothetical protein